MKKSIFILAMLLTAATAFTQTSRRSANSPTPAREEKEKSTATDNKKEVATQRSRSNAQSGNTSAPARREATTRQSGAAVQRNTPSGNQRTTNTPGREAATRQSGTATQSRTQSGNQQTTGTVRREAATSQPANATQSRSQSGNSQTPTESRRGTSSVQSQPNHKPATTNVNRGQTVHQQRSANHTVRNVPRNAGSGTTYVTHYESPRVYRDTRVIHHHYNKAPRNRYYRARHYPYRSPVSLSIYWSPSMRLEYARYYPMVGHWRYTDGYRIPTVSAYDAILYHGEVMNVYGKVYETFYTGKTDEYILYFGAYYPYHDFSVVVPGWVARRLSRWPEQYFERQHVLVTGLITAFEDKPEVVVRNTGQIRIY